MATRIMSPEERQRRSDGAKRAKDRLKSDPIAFAQFKTKTAAAVKKQWAEEDQTDRIANISIGKLAACASMTDDERRSKFGWMNAPHVTAQRKREVWEKSLKKWYDETDQAVISEMTARRTESILKTDKATRVYDNSLPPEHPINAWALKYNKMPDYDLIFGTT